MNEDDDIIDPEPDYTELPLCIISGGQTGADRGGLDAAIALGLDHGGYCPKGRLSEDGAVPSRYLLKETGSAQYGERTALNVIGSHATLIMHREPHGKFTGGTAMTARLCDKHHRPMLSVRVPLEIDKVPEPVVESIRGWLRRHRVLVLNVAGPRESKAPGIEQAVAELLVRVWRPKTHCPKGHEYSADNLRIVKSGWRLCKACHRLGEAAARSRKKASRREAA